MSKARMAPPPTNAAHSLRALGAMPFSLAVRATVIRGAVQQEAALFATRPRSAGSRRDPHAPPSAASRCSTRRWSTSPRECWPRPVQSQAARANPPPRRCSPSSRCSAGTLSSKPHAPIESSFSMSRAASSPAPKACRNTGRRCRWRSGSSVRGNRQRVAMAALVHDSCVRQFRQHIGMNKQGWRPCQCMR